MPPLNSVCFQSAARAQHAPAPLPVAMDTARGLALATVLPFLRCGEESASLVFDAMASAPGHRHASALLNIAREEEQHELLLHGLAAALPEPARPAPSPARIARFYCTVQASDWQIHCSRIAALDAAACTILSRLARSLHRAAPAPAKLLGSIAQDEARHVALMRQMVLGAGVTAALREAAAATRAGLAALLEPAAPAFEAMGVDPDRLQQDLGQLPDGLLHA
jgi:hypothetical protein